MEFTANNIYHIYNRGNNKQTIFYKERNYLYFLEKVRKYIYPHCDVLAYVLMPNHFHLMIHADERTSKSIDAPIKRNVLSEGLRLLLSSYSKGINKQEHMTGNLIQQTTKYKCIYDPTIPFDYACTCFHYIHNNPVKAGLVKAPEEWHYSSYRDYTGLRDGTLCNQAMANKLLDVYLKRTDSKAIMKEESLKHIW